MKNALSGIMASDLLFPSISSVERIRQQHFTYLISKFSKDSSPMLKAGFHMSNFFAFLRISSHFIDICRISITAIVKLYENRESQLVGISSQKTKFFDSLGSVATNCDELG